VTRLFDDVWRPGKAVRLLGVAVTGLGTSVQQLSLLDEGSEKKRRLQTAIDELRERFGSRAVRRGSQLKDEG
jgi:DNA polymerase-4